MIELGYSGVILSNLGGNKFKLLSETLITKQFIMGIKKPRKYAMREM